MFGNQRATPNLCLSIACNFTQRNYCDSATIYKYNVYRNHYKIFKSLYNAKKCDIIICGDTKIKIDSILQKNKGEMYVKRYEINY